MSPSLAGKVALITGASGEIGSEAAIEFAREGATGIVLQYNKGRAHADAVLRKIGALGVKGLVVKADLSRPEHATDLVAAAHSRFKRLDIVVCLAGHPFLREDWFGKFEELTPEQMRRPLEVDLLGSAHVVRAAVPIMKRQRSGKIILTGSTPALTGDVVGIPYLVAKAGLLALTRALAQYLGPYNIQVNALALGAIDTQSTLGQVSPAQKRALVKETSLGRLGTPQEVARTIVFLSNHDSDFVTGQTLIVDGGYAMK